MASLPVYLSQGFISVYGSVSAWGLFDPNESDNNIRFGIINQMNSAPAGLAIGDNVIYNSKDVIAPLFMTDQKYYILEGSKVIAVEYVYNIIPPP